MNIFNHENGLIEWSDGELEIVEDIMIKESETLIMRNCTLRFAPTAGIVCQGKIDAENCQFVAINPAFDFGELVMQRTGWKGIADIGKRRSRFRKCTFIDGRGRPLAELKNHFISRYFSEFDDLEIIEGWSEYTQEDVLDGHMQTYGGALIVLNTSVEECEFVGCKVSGDGGAVVATFNVDIDHCRFERCSAVGDGGAIVMKGPSTLKSTMFVSCRAGGDGGGMLCDSAVRIERCHFKRCVARFGGGMSAYDNARIDDCAFIGCIATRSGGGISGEVSADRLMFKRCVSKRGGGADLDGGSSIENGLFFQCEAKADGGGLFLFTNGPSVVERCRFVRCHAGNTGGGARVRETVMRRCLWRHNTIRTDRVDDMSADHLYASGGTVIQESEFDGCRYEEEGVLQFVLFESTLLQSDYCEEHIDPNFPVLRSTIFPKTLDYFQITPMTFNNIQYMAISNGLPTIAIQQRGTRYADRILATLEPEEKNVEIWDSKKVLSDEENREVKRFIATNYHPLMDHYFSKTSSIELIKSIE